jgi:hypothetical protein
MHGTSLKLGLRTGEASHDYLCHILTFGETPTLAELTALVEERFFIPAEDVGLHYFDSVSHSIVIRSEGELREYLNSDYCVPALSKEDLQQNQIGNFKSNPFLNFLGIIDFAKRRSEIYEVPWRRKLIL